MKHKLLTVAQVILVATMATMPQATAGHPAYAQPIDPARAMASKPKVDEIQVYSNLTQNHIRQFLATGKQTGQRIFTEDFTGDAKRWKFNHHTKLVPDGRGGCALLITPVDKAFSEIYLQPEHYIPVTPTHPIAVFWEARAPQKGNPARIRIDFFDKKKQRLNANQIRSTTDPTQPTLFARNAFYANKWMPGNAAFMRLSFHQSPIPADTLPAEIARISVVDLDQAVKDDFSRIALPKDQLKNLTTPENLALLPKLWQNFAHQALTRLDKPTSHLDPQLVRRALRLQDAIDLVRQDQKLTPVLAYPAPDLCTGFPIMPTDFQLPGKPNAPILVRECPGEMTRAAVTLWSPQEWKDVTLEFSSLRKHVFWRLPPETMSAKIVKPWFQAVGSPFSFIAFGNDQVLMPDLLLHDDSLVIPDHTSKHNLVKYQLDGKQWYVDINTVYSKTWAEPIPVDKMPITDAPTLQPFTLRADENKQLMIRFDIPRDASDGTYEGTITLRSQGQKIAEIPVRLEVLPFSLPRKAETVYSPDQEYTMGLYYWGLLAKDDKPRISVMAKSKQQLLAELKLMTDNSILNPTMIWGNDIIFNEPVFRTYLETVRAAGLKDNLYLGSSGNLGNPTKPEDLKALQKRLKKAMDIAAEYGFKQVYFYGFDEARGTRLMSQIPAWKAAQEIGAKIIVSGYEGHFEKVGKHLDICVYASDLNTAHPEDWHRLGHKIWKYNTPQAGCEDPNLYRRNYGLHLWSRGFDGGNTYCFLGHSTAWNDIASYLRNPNAPNHYRGMCMAYPTTDGVIETLSITGLHDAMKDIRYMTKLRQLLRQTPNQDAQRWFDSINFETADLTQVRRQTIDWILKLQLGSPSGGAVSAEGDD